MHKGRVFLSIAVAAGSFALAALACDDETASEFDDTARDAGFAESGPSLIDPDAAASGDARRPVTCDPTRPEGFSPRWTAPTRATACSADELGGYYDACLTPRPADGGDPCKEWKETGTHATCAACIEPTDNSGPIQWHRDRYYWTLNLAGCLSLERDEPGADKCPATYAASIQCQRDSCDGCFESGQATFADFQACQAGSKANACADYEGKIGQVCGSTYNDPDGGAFDCFRKPEDKSDKQHFVRVEGIFCGQ